MAYNAQAETFSAAAAVEHHASGMTDRWTRFLQIYSEIADATPTDEAWRLAGLIGQLPTLAHYAPSTQADILRVVARDMVALNSGMDGLVRVRNGWYRWRFAS